MSWRISSKWGLPARCAVPGAGEEVVHAQDVAAVGEQALAQVGAQKTCSACHKDALAGAVGSHWVTLQNNFASRLSLDLWGMAAFIIV